MSNVTQTAMNDKELHMVFADLYIDKDVANITMNHHGISLILIIMQCQSTYILQASYTEENNQ